MIGSAKAAFSSIQRSKSHRIMRNAAPSFPSNFRASKAFLRGASLPPKPKGQCRSTSMQTTSPSSFSACCSASACWRARIRARSVLEGVVRPALALLDHV